jgi:5-methylcytosine-specific restriction endonuclease McrA
MTISSATLRWLEHLIRQDKLIPFYKCKEWRALRQEALERDNFECQECKRKGRYKRAQNVHHLKEVKARPDLALELNNLECICIACHNAVHDKRLRNDHRKPFVNEERW